MSQVVVVATVRAKDGQREAALDALRRLAEHTHTEAGCLAYAIHEDAQDRGRLVVVERWTSQVALENHALQPYLKEILGGAREILEGPPDVRVLTPVPAGDPVKGTL
jgi:quinol monooxygenase YgiN